MYRKYEWFIFLRYRIVAEENKDVNSIRDSLGNGHEKENGANEILDFPLHDIDAIDKKRQEKFEKKHIDTLGMGGDKDKMYDGFDYDKVPGNEANPEENEEDGMLYNVIQL